MPRFRTEMMLTEAAGQKDLKRSYRLLFPEYLGMSRCLMQYPSTALERKECLMLGTIVNTAAIIVGSLIGLLFKGSIPEKYSKQRGRLVDGNFRAKIADFGLSAMQKMGKMVGTPGLRRPGRAGKRICGGKPDLLRGGHGHCGFPGERTVRQSPDIVR